MSRWSALRPGSTPWLVRHEIRLAWRGIGSRRVSLLLSLLALLAVGAHVGAWFLVRHWPAGALPPIATYLLGGAVWVCISLMLSQGILGSVTALFDRGDLDLLLSSPIPTRHVFMARALGIAFNAVVLYLALLAPIADVGLFAGHPALLAIYPTMIGLALAVAALGIAVTLLLVGLIGARRARTFAQVLGTLVGAAFFLCTQGPNMLGPAASRAFTSRVLHWTEPGGPLALDSLVWLPARAMQGEPLPLLGVFSTGALALWLVVGLAHKRFLAGTQESVGGSARRGQATRRAGAARFGGGLGRNVLVKEWRLILRDPQLISQTLMQVFYLLPTMFLLLRSETKALALVVPGVVFLASSLVGSLAWITVAAEDAPDLLGASPNPMSRLRVLKLLAALLPVWALVSPVLVWLAITQPTLALVFLFCVAGGTVSVGIGQVWYPRQGKRTDMKRRMQGHGVLGIVELVVIVGWVATAWTLSARPLWSPLALAVAAFGSGAVWLLGRSRRQDSNVGGHGDAARIAA
jgi:ABC-2 type transport system permease protein